MKKINHRIISTGIAVLSGAKPEGIIGAFVGATFPDIDLAVGIRHRTITHWLPIYLLPLGILLAMADRFQEHPLLFESLLWFLLGAILHLVEDIGTPAGLPILTPFPKKNFSLKFTKTGGRLEYVLSLSVFIALAVTASFHPEKVTSLIKESVTDVSVIVSGIGQSAEKERES